MTEPMPEPAVPDAQDAPAGEPTQVGDEELAQHEADVAAAQGREEDPDGDPDAIDIGDIGTEEASEADPPEADQLNADADDDLSDLDTESDPGIEDFGDLEDDDEEDSDGSA